MKKKYWGLAVPLLVASVTAMGVLVFSPRAAVAHGIYMGLIIALAQSYLSTAALIWAWNKNFFYWVWGGGMLFRMLVFAGTAFVVYEYTELSFTATMVSMVAATTLFLVVESSIFISKPT